MKAFKSNIKEYLKLFLPHYDFSPFYHSKFSLLWQLNSTIITHAC